MKSTAVAVVFAGIATRWIEQHCQRDSLMLVAAPTWNGFEEKLEAE
jgi:hypothetical protein